MSSPIQAAGLVIFKNIVADCGKKNTLFLLLKHNNTRGSWWTPPKGHLEKGETPMDAAIRETEEEACLVNNKDYQICQSFKKELHYTVKKKGIMRDKVVTYWLAELNDSINIDSIKISHEHTDYQWADLESAYEIAGFEETKNLLRECLAYIASQ